MKYTFTFDMEPLSTNRLTRVVRGRPIKSAEARLFHNNIQQFMRFSYNRAAIEIKQRFKPEIHGIKLWFKIYKPNVMKKTGGLNQRSGDIDNALKQYVDSIFKYLEIDDSFVTHISAEKHQADEVNVEIQLEIYEIENP